MPFQTCTRPSPLARLIKQRQPRLYGYLLSHRNKHQLRDLLNLKATPPILLHVSSMYPVELGCIAPGGGAGATSDEQ